MPAKAKEVAAGRLVLSTNTNTTKDSRLAMSASFALAQHNQILRELQKHPQSKITPPESPQDEANPPKRQRLDAPSSNMKVAVQEPNVNNLPPVENGHGTSEVEPTIAGRSYAQKLGRKIIEFRVGPQKEPFDVHKKLLQDNVQALFTNKPDTVNTISFEFPDDDPEAFELLIEYCYKEELAAANETTSTDDCYKRLKLYCLAEKYEQNGLMNNCMDFLMAYLRSKRPSWPISWCSYAYQHTSSGSPLRNLMSRWFAFKFLQRKDKGKWTTREFSTVALEHPDLVHDAFRHIRPSPEKRMSNPQLESVSFYYVGLEEATGSRDNSETAVAESEDLYSE